MIQRVTDAVRRFGRAAVLLSLVAGALAGCADAGNAQAPAAAQPAGGDRLYIAGGDEHDNSGTFVLDAASGAVQRKLPSGYISPDWSTLYEVALARESTTVRAYDLATGRVLRETAVPGRYDVPVMPENPLESAFSPDGRWLALVAR
ncbi:MAG: hypothetical protein ACM30E_09125, partial [Nitrososphaerales archaeon]